MEINFLCVRLVHLLSIVFLNSLGLTISEPVEYEGASVVTEGESFMISCRLTQFDAIKWLKDNQQIDDVQQSMVDSRNQYVFDDREENGLIVASLSVKSALLNHSGSYRCSSLSNESHNLFVIGGSGAVESISNIKLLNQLKDLELVCKCPEGSNPTKYDWLKNDKELEKGSSPHYKFDNATLTILKGTDVHAGNYSCRGINVNNKEICSNNFEVMSEPFVKLSSYMNVVEEEKLRIECTVLGNPTPIVSWRFNNNTTFVNSTGRVTLMPDDKKVPNAVFIIDSVTMEDKGEYSCIAENPKVAVNATKGISVVVKGKFDALWPFLGIVAEVVVLCAIILIYEKKRNKAELEESDTDQSPDQKNTPDHGKDSVRHRK